jgi:predicted HicB family RNase H-like nuclease
MTFLKSFGGTPRIFAIPIYARFVTIFSVNPDRKKVVIEFTKLLGRVIHELIFKTRKERPKHIRLNRFFWLLKNWRSIMAQKNDKYTYRVTWSEEDNEYIGLCAEFPSLSWLADTPEKALKGIRKTVAEVISDMGENNEKIPEPIACKRYSGKFMVRIPPHIHRKLAIQAAESGISLNRIASSKLSQ